MIDPVQALAGLPTAIMSAAAHSTSQYPAFPSATVVPIAPEVEYQHAGDAGKRTLWIVFVIMSIATLVFAGMSWSIPVSRRLYHVVTTIIVMTAALSYFAMATGDGVSYHHTRVIEKNKHQPDTFVDVYRQVYYARYIDWSITTPLLLLDLCLLAGLNGAHTIMAIVADLVMIFTGLFAAFGTDGTPQKWGWYAIACIAYLFVIWHLAINGRSVAQSKSNKVGALFGSLALFTLILWTAYPIVWGIADGARIASVNTEIIAYAVLDVMAKVVFGFWLLIAHQNLPESNLAIGGWWANGISSEGSIRVGDDEDGA